MGRGRHATGRYGVGGSAPGIGAAWGWNEFADFQLIDSICNRQSVRVVTDPKDGGTGIPQAEKQAVYPRFRGRVQRRSRFVKQQ